jgi:hypothetical protein
MTTGLQARIYDPLWLLARQWQIGEFQGEDNGSPAMANFRADASRLTRFRPGAIAPETVVKAAEYDPSETPLETLAERERVLPLPAQQLKPQKLRLAVDAGLQFLRAVDQQAVSRNYRDVFMLKYPLPPITAQDRDALDADSVAFLELMVGRVPDGRQIYASLKPDHNGAIALPADLNIAHADTAEVQQAIRVWRTWYETIFSEPETADSSWVPERMEYAFSVGSRLSDSEIALTAQEYYEGNLDWYDFDLNFDVSLGAANDDAIKQIAHTNVPAPVTFRGAPANRFWELEDARVDFGSLKAEPEDLVRMLLIEFAITYGNDWFVIPVELPVGTICRSEPLIVTNTFGERFMIRSAKNSGPRYAAWRMFELSFMRKPDQPPTTSDLLFLPPSLMRSIESRPIEEVLFVRDEMANMAWGIEHIVESACENPLNRFEQQRYFVPEVGKQANAEVLRYQLATQTPSNWVPLLPVRTDAGLRLQRGKVLKIDGPPEFIAAHGSILNPEGPVADGLAIHEEEVLREGVSIVRHYQLARWQGGTTHLWMGRKKRVGKGEGSSGLRFDTVTRS